MTAPARVRQADVARFFRGAADAGVTFSKVSFNPTTGEITAFTGAPDPANDTGGPNEWDDELPT